MARAPRFLPMAPLLGRLAADVDRDARRAADPVGFVHQFTAPADQEVVGLIAALLAFGNVRAIRRSVAEALTRVGPAPAEAIRALDREAWRARMVGFVHRVYRGDDLAEVLTRAGALARAHGTLGAAFAASLSRSDGDLRAALAWFAGELRGPDPGRGLRHLVPDPRAGSACKRLHLYLRWMVRPADGVDLGLWPVSPAALLVPVDTHVLRIGRNLGFTRRRDASWRTAEEITAALRAFDPADPVRFDFALCHHGISGDCPSRRDAEKCGRCVLRPACCVWR